MPTSVLRRAPGSPALPPALVRQIGNAMLTELGLEHAELSVLLTNDREIHALNLQHRAKDRPTDVLAFPLEELEESASAPGSAPSTPAAPHSSAWGARLLGDVVISLDTAARQARGRKRELVPEVRFLLAHGLLHLLGYDHGNPKEKRAMTAMTRRLVRAVARVTANPHKITKARATPARAASLSRPRKAGKRPGRARARHAK